MTSGNTKKSLSKTETLRGETGGSSGGIFFKSKEKNFYLANIVSIIITVKKMYKDENPIYMMVKCIWGIRGERATWDWDLVR